MRKLLIPFICLVFLLCSGMIIVRNFPSNGGSPSPDPTDQFSGNPVQSVGVTATSLFSTGTVTISGNIATFSSAFPTNVGVGDCIVYGSNYAIIKGINSDRTKAYVTTKDGSSAPASVSASSFNIYRSFTSLANWESQTQNANITPTITLTDRDLTDTDDEDGPLYVACYADGVDTNYVEILNTDWTVDSDDYIQIFTPTDSEMVGVSQCHNGTYGNGYRIESNRRYYAILVSDLSYIKIIGISIKSTADSGAYYYVCNMKPGANGEVYLENCIIVGNNMTDGYIVSSDGSDPTAKIYVKNTIIYDSDDNGLYCRDGQVIAYNVTVSDCAYGIYQHSTGTDSIVKNCLVQNAASACFSGTFDSASDYNCAESGTVPGSNSVVGTVTFVDETNDNFHLASSDTVAKDAGTDLSSDPYLAFTDDVDGETRSGTWDIGADEYVE